MKRIMVGCAAVMILGLAAWVSAQVPADRQFLAFQWPDDCLPVIDGDISEWYAIPDVYAITLEDLVDAFGAAADKSSCDPYGWLAYNPNDDFYSLHWFDCMGSPPEVFVGGFEGDVLTVAHGGPGMHARMTYDLSTPGTMKGMMEMSPDGKDWNVLFEATYTRR